ncbi:nuclear transport factor 2 family protein [Rubrivirga marina]|uniref:nuclear transport factor 2 family protein n=1 Tax=Rubrivirga marina TaxID=1196024 RepID=UPI0015C764EB|nr:nuclear transport factor 2 family protein [Rubrivirga marina]
MRRVVGPTRYPTVAASRLPSSRSRRASWSRTSFWKWSGGIHYKHAEIQAASVRFVGTTAIVLNTIRLDAVVGGNEVTNPFEVTEVYVREGSDWTLASLSFTRLLR